MQKQSEHTVDEAGKGNLSRTQNLSHVLDDPRIFATVMDHANEAVIITRDGVILAANREATIISGWSVEEMSTKPFLEFVHPEDRRIVEERYRMRLSNQAPDEKFQVFRLLDKKGNTRHLEATGTSIKWKGKPAGLHFLTEVTRRLQAEAQIRASEAQYRYLVENASDAIAIIQDRAIRFINQASASMLGYLPEEVTTMDVLNLVHPDSREHVIAASNRRFKGERIENPYNFDALTKSGKRINAQLTAAMIEWEGRPALLALIRDVTESRKMEEQLQQAQRMEALGTLAGGIAHDFNNLLMAVQGHASLMLLGTSQGDQYYKSLKCIEQCVKSGAELTSQLLGYAKGGRYQVRPKNINSIIQSTAAMFGRARREIRIHQDLAPDLWISDVDQTQIEQVLLNLYVNAWHAMDQGGDLSIRTTNCTVNPVQALGMGIGPGKYVKVVITDTGIGMDEATRKRIFEPFFTTREMGRGTGLGLASAYGIIKSHGGFIQVYSEKGKGATFSIFLARSEKAPENREPAPSTAYQGEGLVLLADDEEMIRDVGSQMLTELGHNVITAADGHEAVRMFKEQAQEIKLVILDVIMPGSDVTEVFKIIREISPDARILLSSGYSVEGQAQKLMDKGCNGFIQKPFNMEELADKVRAVCPD